MARGRSRLTRVAAPLAFLLAATVAILLVRSAMDAEGDTAPPATTAAATAPATTAPATTAATTGTAATAPEGRFYVVQEGDTLATIADAEGTSVDQLLQLNPGIDPVALRIGQRIRVE